MNIAIIPARGGSRRIPGKNTRNFHGKPILAYAIENARASHCFDKVVVSTEHDGTRAVARAYGAGIHNRPEALADDDVGTQAVMRSALRWWTSSAHDKEPEFACCIYATTPLLNSHDLYAGLTMLRYSTKDYVYTVDEGGNDIGGFYWGRAQAFMDGVPLDGNSAHMVIPQHRCCDINTEDDWQRAERLYADLRATASLQHEQEGCN